MLTAIQQYRKLCNGLSTETLTRRLDSLQQGVRDGKPESHAAEAIQVIKAVLARRKDDAA